MPPLVIGVVLYRTGEAEKARLLRSLELARAQPGAPEFRLLLVDNTPPGANRGFGATHNALLRAAFAEPSTEAYLCLNPDAFVHPRMLAALWKERAARAGAGLIEAMQFPDEHAKPWDPETHDTPHCSGCALVITRAAWEATGGFDERFFLYAEDVDLSWRVRAAGLRCVLAPDALVFHYVGDRPSDRARYAHSLRAAMQLCAKFGDALHAKEYLAELSRIGEPDVLPPMERQPEALSRLAVLDKGVAFSKVRW